MGGVRQTRFCKPPSTPLIFHNLFVSVIFQRPHSFGSVSEALKDCGISCVSRSQTGVRKANLNPYLHQRHGYPYSRLNHAFDGNFRNFLLFEEAGNIPAYCLPSLFSYLRIIGHPRPPSNRLSTNRKHDIIMRISQFLQLYSTLFLFLSVLTSAWPWPRFLPDVDSLIVRRQNGGSGSNGSGCERLPPNELELMLMLSAYSLIPAICNEHRLISTYTDCRFRPEYNHFCSVVRVWFRC
jgi:hypothetical protein